MKHTPKHKAAALLQAWLAATGRKQAWVAKQLGVGHTAVSRWASGITAPDIATRRRLSALTRGKVPVTSWEASE